MKHTKSGFSLVELMVGLSLFLLILTLVLSQGSYLKQARLSLELEKIHALCWYAQKRAMVTGQVQKVIFEPDQGIYTCDDYREHLGKGVKFGWIPGAKGPPACPSKQINSAVTFKNNTVLLHPDGIIGAGSVYLVDSDKKRMYALTSGVGTVSFLRKYRYAKHWQIQDNP